MLNINPKKKEAMIAHERKSVDVTPQGNRLNEEIA
jgi:hypothetical protein